MTAPRPSLYPAWTDGAPSKVLQPPGPISSQGWLSGQAPPPKYMNWLFWLNNEWVKYFDSVISDGEPTQVLRLLGGGYWKFNKSTGALSWTDNAYMAITGVPDANNVIAGPDSVTILDGQIAYVEINLPQISAGDSAIGSNTLTNVPFTGDIVIGMSVIGPGVPSGTVVTGVGLSSVTMNNTATANNTGATYIFAGSATLVPTVADSDDFIADVSKIMFAKRVGDVIYWGVNTSQMTLFDKEFKQVLRSGYFDSYEAVAGENLTAGEAVYISAGSPIDTGRTAGRVYKLDVSATYQDIRGVFAGIVISDTTSGNTGTVLYNGFYEYVSLSSGKSYYANPATPGGIIDYQPSGAGEKIVQVGFANTTTSLIVSATQNANGLFVKPIFGAEILGYGPGTAFSLSTAPFNQDSVFLYIDGVILPKSEWSILGSAITLNSSVGAGVEVYAQYVKAQQSYVNGVQQIADGVTDGVNDEFTINGQPVNQVSTWVYKNGLVVTSDLWSLSYITGGQAKITFDTPPGIGDEIYVAFLEAVTPPTEESALAANGTSASSPATVTAGTGIVIGSESRQIRWVKSSGGAVVITATPQVQAGSFVGQELWLRGGHNTDYITLNDGNGLKLTLPWNSTIDDSIALVWDGTDWAEMFRR